MNKKLEDFKMNIRNKRVAVLGIGISNTPLIRYLAGIGVDITAFDQADEKKLEPTLAQLRGLDVKYNLGSRYLENLKGFDVIFKTPKIRFDIPELIREKELGAVITSEMEVFINLCPGEIFAVTGSDGKTTTTTLIYNILKKHGYDCWLGGNIGTPLLDRIEEIRETDKVVLELSSFQLHTMKNRLHTAVITNITPNHLDVHKSLDEYIDAKKNIFRFQGDNDKLVLNFDNEVTRKFAEKAAGKVIFFSRKHILENGAFIKDGRLVFKETGICTDIIALDDILLPGMHNVENYLAAICATSGYVQPEAIYSVATSFTGVQHRMELVRELKGIKFYNDSIGTSPARTIAGLKSFKQKVILIAGGYDKQISYDELGEVIAEKVKCLILIGPTGPKIKTALEKTGKGDDLPVIMCDTFEDTVIKAYLNAVKGDIVVLSPASASFDLFKNFEERGNKFKQIVNNLA